MPNSSLANSYLGTDFSAETIASNFGKLGGMSVLLSIIKLPDADIGKVITNTSAVAWFCRCCFLRLYSIYMYLQQSLSRDSVKDQINSATTISSVTSTGSYDSF